MIFTMHMMTAFFIFLMESQISAMDLDLVTCRTFDCGKRQSESSEDIRDVAFSINEQGNKLAVMLCDTANLPEQVYSIKIWNLQTEHIILENNDIKGAFNWCYAPYFDTTGTKLGLIGKNIFSIYNLKTNQEEFILESSDGYQGINYSIACFDTQSYVYLSHVYGQLIRYATDKSNKILGEPGEISKNTIRAMCYNEKQGYLASVNTGDMVSIFDFEQNTIKKFSIESDSQREKHGSHIKICCNKDGDTLLAVNMHGEIYTIDVEKGNVNKHIVDDSLQMQDICFDTLHESFRLLFSNSSSSSIVYDLENNKISTLCYNFTCLSAMLHSSGKFIAIKGVDEENNLFIKIVPYRDYSPLILLLSLVANRLK